MTDRICAGCKTGTELVAQNAEFRLKSISILAETVMSGSDDLDSHVTELVIEADMSSDVESALRQISTETREEMVQIVNSVPALDVVCDGKSRFRGCAAQVVLAASE